MAPSRSLVSFILFGGLVSAGTLQSRSLRARQLPPCLEDCLVTYDSETQCPTTQGQEVFNECWCTDTTEAGQNLETCVSQCDSDVQDQYNIIMADICEPYLGGGSTTTSDFPTSTTTDTAPTPTGSEESCPLVCLNAYIAETDCLANDTECFCTDSSDAADNLNSCLSDCTIAEQQDFESQKEEVCSAITSSSSSSTSTTDEPTSTESTDEPTSTDDGSANTDSPSSTDEPEETTPTTPTRRVRTSTIDAPEETGAAGYVGSNLIAMAGGVLAVMAAL